MNKTKISLIITLVMVAVILVSLFSPIEQFTLISSTQVNIEQYGGLDGNRVTGTYWSLLLAVDYTDQVSFYEFNDVEAHKTAGSAWWQGKNVTVKNKVTLKIDPERPYYERPMQLRSVKVVPSARQNWVGFASAGRDDDDIVQALYSGHWETTTSDWILHTPIRVTVLVNGTEIGSQLIDTIGVVDTTNIALGKTMSISKTSNEYLTITNLGALQTGYTFPIWQSVVWFNNQYFYLNSEAVRAAIRNPYPDGNTVTRVTSTLTQDATFTGWRNSFAWYWYGYASGTEVYDWYWKDNGEPCPFKSALLGYMFLPEDKSPGWVSETGDVFISRIKPWGRPPRLPTDSKPSGALCLTQFLETKALARKPSMPSWEPNANNVQFVTTSAQNGFLRVYLPWSSFTRLLNVRISAELANTVIWEPQVANLQIINCPSDVGDIGERKTVSITLRQLSNVASAGYVKLVPVTSSLYWSFDPPAFGTGTIQPGVTKTFTFDVVNLGQPSDTAFKFKVEVYNSLGQLTDSREVTGVLKARGMEGSTLTIRTIDKETRVDISGIHVIVNYDTTSKDAWTSGGAVSFDFEGGTPIVTISTVETTVYKSATVSKELTLGPNDETIELIKHGEPDEEDWWSKYWWLVIIAVTITLALIIVAVRKRKRKL